jgi:hypothetical protein
MGNGQRPGRQAGRGFVNEMSTEGAAQQRVSRLQRSSNPPNLSRPDGPGPIDCRSFGPPIHFLSEF